MCFVQCLNKYNDTDRIVSLYLCWHDTKMKHFSFGRKLYLQESLL